MRKKSEARRAQILKTAKKLFLANGYEKTSMDELTAKLGYSKATIYNYFPSKKELFSHAIHDIVLANTKKTLSMLTKLKGNKEQFWPSLHTFAVNYLKLQLSAESLGIARIAISEGERMNLADVMHQYENAAGWTEIAECFQDAMTSNYLREADPMRAAMHFKGLLESDILDKRLKTIIYKVSDEQIDGVITSAIDVFKRAYQV